ncbi:MAG: translocation/assembly module TamB domain-containing protein, partial [Bacteroidota bacterium]
LTFVDKKAELERSKLIASTEDDRTIEGLSFEMDLEVTEESKIRIIFDEQAGDIIEGSGRGNLRMLLPRGQEFQMFGNYIIERGDYLFTLYNVVNKDFRINRGGTVKWTGDPFKAEIDIQAEYKNLNAPVSNFIQEYLLAADADLKNEASQATNVDLSLNLQGELMQPIVSFDIDFPNLRGQLQNYTDSKLRILKQDQNELNKQVFGLILAGQFLPSDFGLQGSQILFNTVSELLSNQLSLLITELFSEFIGEGEVLTSIDFDIAYNQYQSVDLGDGQDVNGGEEVQVRLKQNFFNNKLSILVGGNIDINNSLQSAPGTNNGAFIGNDFVLEYAITNDRSLKLQVYQRLEPDIGGGRRFQIGTGLSYRKEYKSFKDFLRSFKKDANNSKKKNKKDRS